MNIKLDTGNLILGLIGLVGVCGMVLSKFI